jgi:hypothetical protein
MVSISVHLHGKPAHELDNEGELLTAEHLRTYADGLHDHLRHTAGVLERLERGGAIAVLAAGVMTGHRFWSRHWCRSPGAIG